MTSPFNSSFRVNITTSTIIKFLGILLLLYLCYIVREILALLFVSLILAAAIDPWVDKMQEWKMPRFLGVSIIYFMIAILVSGAIILIIPPIIEQTNTLIESFPYYFEKIKAGLSIIKDYSIEHGLLERMKSNLDIVESNITQAAGSIFSTVSGIFGGIISFFIVLVITFYMVVEEDALKKIVQSLTPPKHQLYTMQLINRMQRQIGYWLRGQLILMFLVGFLTWVGLLFVLPEYALVLALIAGLTEFVPYLGPFLGAIPAVFLAFTISPPLALLVIIIYLVIQQVEGHILVPQIMERAVGLNPIISIAVLMAGLKLGGIVGGLLSIPVATALSVFIKDMVRARDRRERSGEN